MKKNFLIKKDTNNDSGEFSSLTLSHSSNNSQFDNWSNSYLEKLGNKIFSSLNLPVWPERFIGEQIFHALRHVKLIMKWSIIFSLTHLIFLFLLTSQQIDNLSFSSLISFSYGFILPLIIMIGCFLSFTSKRSFNGNAVLVSIFIQSLNYFVLYPLFQDLFHPGNPMFYQVAIPIAIIFFLNSAIWNQSGFFILNNILAYLMVFFFLLLNDISFLKSSSFIYFLLIASLSGFVLRNARLNIAHKVFQSRKELSQKAHKDPLTSLLNRAGWEKQITSLEINGKMISPGILYLDLDKFKSINDNFGHEVGDQVLKSVSNLLSDFSPLGSLVCRPGGEEFWILIPNTNYKSLYMFAEEVRISVENLNDPVPITISIGGVMKKNNETINDAIIRADFLSIEAKEKGRNKVVFEQLK